MLLAVDIGNTDIVFGLHDGERWRHIWRTPTLHQQSAFHYESFLKLQLLEAGIPAMVCSKVVISSVVPALTTILHQVTSGVSAAPPVVVGAGSYPPLRIEIDYPYELGSDLIANAVAVFERYRQHCIVVDFGTALTFTTVTGDGRLLGVAIAPGLKTAVKALFANTAQLPEVPLEPPVSAIGRNTAEAIRSGVLLGYEGLVKTMIARIRTELEGEAIVVATGGLSGILETLKPEFTEIDPALTLEGLRIIGTYTKGPL